MLNIQPWLTRKYTTSPAEGKALLLKGRYNETLLITELSAIGSREECNMLISHPQEGQVKFENQINLTAAKCINKIHNRGKMSAVYIINSPKSDSSMPNMSKIFQNNFAFIATLDDKSHILPNLFLLGQNKYCGISVSVCEISTFMKKECIYKPTGPHKIL